MRLISRGDGGFLHLRSAGTNALRALGAVGIAVSLAACGSSNGLFGRGPGDPPAPTVNLAMPQPPGPAEQIGSGPVRVALILPLTQASGPSVVGLTLRLSLIHI